MENPGCVTFRDTYVYRGAVTPDQLFVRDNTIAHEMAHMWFGDLVTMRWWDDLWLNESFAEYMAYRTMVDAMGADEAWVEFGIVRKLWGYAAERSPSTHPVAGSPAPDALSALANFDGISYAKGASVLRQLIAHIGDDAFLAGVTDHLRAHAFGNGDLSEFLEAMGRAAGAPLEHWARAWLQTAGADRVALGRDGALTRTVPAEHPADRPHTLDVAAFDDGGREVLREQVVLQGDTVVVDGVDALPASVLLVPNASDLTWAEVALDDVTLAALPASLAGVDDPLARQVVWTAVLGGVHRAEVDPRLVVSLLERAWPQEDDAAVLSRVTRVVLDDVVPHFLPPDEQDAALATFARAAEALAARAESAGGGHGDALAVAAARAWAQSGSDVERLRRWASGEGLPEALVGDDDFRWVVLRRLAVLGHLTEDEVADAAEADRSMAGQRAALGVRAALPTAAAKDWAWRTLHDDTSLSNYGALAVAGSFWAASDPDLVRPYVPRVGDLVVQLSRRMGDDALERVAALLHPGALVEEASLEASTAVLARDDLTPGVRRSLVDADHVLREALASRRRFG